MNAPSKLPEFVDFMRSAATLPGILTGAADDLKASNDAAAKDQEARDREALAAMLKRYGACNTVTMLSDACYDLHADTDIADWNAAGTLLGDAANAVNLTYAEPAAGPTDAQVAKASAAIRAGRGTPGDYAAMREVS